MAKNAAYKAYEEWKNGKFKGIFVEKLSDVHLDFQGKVLLRNYPDYELYLRRGDKNIFVSRQMVLTAEHGLLMFSIAKPGDILSCQVR